jgi:hypothetical protein
MDISYRRKFFNYHIELIPFDIKYEEPDKFINMPRPFFRLRSVHFGLNLLKLSRDPVLLKE